MNCKNCSTQLNTEDNFCNACGAHVVTKRITLKGLLSDVLASLGWDNRFFVTSRDLIIRPQLVFSSYLGGTRKKHTNPFTYFAIGVALSVLVINFYSDRLVQIATQASLKPAKTVVKTLPQDENATDAVAKPDYMEMQQSYNKKIIDFQYKYYYYLSFLLLPFYALIALLVFRKPENYGEHLVINAYIQGLLFFFGLVLVALTFILDTDVHSLGSIVVTIIYYSYAYKKYRKYTFWQITKKILRFFVILLVIMLLLSIVGFVIGKAIAA